MNRIYLSLGSNIGDRREYLSRALEILSKSVTEMVCSSIYETKPWGILGQRKFLNMCIKAKTSLSPEELLVLVKKIERDLGRTQGQVNGPREVDVDILLFNDLTVQTKELTIPHPRMYERDFVLKPLLELYKDMPYSLSACAEKHVIKKYAPTQIIGILNLSPESFSGDAYVGIDEIHKRVEEMLAQGVDCIDVGAQSTCPGALQISEEEELRRVHTVITYIKKEFPRVTVSIDSTRISVIKVAIEEGVDIVNDISGGRFSKDVFAAISGTSVKYIMSHSQGDFKNIHADYIYTDVVRDLKKYFRKHIKIALKYGVAPNQIIIDPGIGLSKKMFENFEIIRRIPELRELGFPICIGLSRKRFIGLATGITNPAQRDVATTVLHAECIKEGVEYIRTHNVSYLKQALDIFRYLE